MKTIKNRVLPVVIAMLMIFTALPFDAISVLAQDTIPFGNDVYVQEYDFQPFPADDFADISNGVVDDIFGWQYLSLFFEDMPISDIDITPFANEIDEEIATPVLPLDIEPFANRALAGFYRGHHTMRFTVRNTAGEVLARTNVRAALTVYISENGTAVVDLIGLPIYAGDLLFGITIPLRRVGSVDWRRNFRVIQQGESNQFQFHPVGLWTRRNPTTSVGWGNVAPAPLGGAFHATLRGNALAMREPHSFEPFAALLGNNGVCSECGNSGDCDYCRDFECNECGGCGPCEVCGGDEYCGECDKCNRSAVMPADGGGFVRVVREGIIPTSYVTRLELIIPYRDAEELFSVYGPIALLQNLMGDYISDFLDKKFLELNIFVLERLGEITAAQASAAKFFLKLATIEGIYKTAEQVVHGLNNLLNNQTLSNAISAAGEQPYGFIRVFADVRQGTPIYSVWPTPWFGPEIPTSITMPEQPFLSKPELMERLEDYGHPYQNPIFLIINSPVDVSVYDSQGQLLATIVNQISTNMIDTGVYVWTEVGTKMIYLPPSDNYVIRFMGTDIGTMTYTMEVLNALTHSPISSKTFENIALYPGRLMLSEIVRTYEIALFIEDDGEIVAEILADGAENSDIAVVTFDKNGGDRVTSPSMVAVTPGTNINILPTHPIKHGHDFMGWNTEADGRGGPFTEAAIVTQNITVYAQWEIDPRTYTITFVAEGAENVPKSQVKNHDLPLTLSDAVPTRDGINFIAWVTDTQPPRYYQPGDIFTANEDTTLRAVWFHDAYDILFDRNGGVANSMPGSHIKLHDIPITLPTTIPTRANHHFMGWELRTTYPVAVYQPGQVFEQNGNITLFAKWELLRYNVEFDATSGAFVCDCPDHTQEKRHGINLALMMCRPVREGYYFLGWNRNRNATTATHQPGGNFTGNTDTTFYAIWRQARRVSFDANGGSDPPPSRNFPHNVARPLPSEIPVRAGYDFIGWNQNRNAITATHRPSQNFTATANVTFFAVWARGAGSIGINTQTPAVIESGGQIVTFEFTPETTGTYVFQVRCESNRAVVGSVYNLAGTRLANNSNSTGLTSISRTFNAGVTYRLAARFNVAANTGELHLIVRTTYTVSYDRNGGTGGTLTNQQKIYGIPITLRDARPNRAGFDFLGWSTERQEPSLEFPLDVDFQPSDAFHANADTVLHAVWGVGYTITFNANNGSNPPASQIKQRGVPLTLRTGIPTRTGFTFEGWSLTQYAAGYAGASVDYPSGGIFNRDGENRTLFAVWSTNIYTITFDANGGIGEPDPVQRTRGTTIQLPLEVPTREGHDFLRWALTRTGTSGWLPGANYTRDGNVTLFAVWRAHTYRITFDRNTTDTVTNMPPAQTKSHDVPLTLPSNVPRRTGFVFLGWSTDSSATQSTYEPGNVFTANAPTTLFAVWARPEEVTYTISFNANDGYGAPVPQTKSHGITLVLSDETPTREGHIFLGWATSSIATTPTHHAGGDFDIDANRTLFAVWQEILPVDITGVIVVPRVKLDALDIRLRLNGVETSHTPTLMANNGDVVFTFHDVDAGTYTIAITKTAHTDFTINNVIAGNNDVDLRNDPRTAVQQIELAAGDINGSGQVTEDDLEIIMELMDTEVANSSSPFADIADLDGNGWITISDLFIVVNNMGRRAVVID